jgi:hypothetical protein
MPWKVVSGYYRYHHAVPGNLIPLAIFRHRLTRLWRTVLVRRSQRAAMSWERFYALLDRWIPAPRVLHPGMLFMLLKKTPGNPGSKFSCRRAHASATMPDCSGVLWRFPPPGS